MPQYRLTVADNQIVDEWEDDDLKAASTRAQVLSRQHQKVNGAVGAYQLRELRGSDWTVMLGWAPMVGG